MAKIVNFKDYVGNKNEDAMAKYHLETFLYDGCRYEKYISENANKHIKNIKLDISNAFLSKDSTIDSQKIVQLANYINAANGVKKEIHVEQLPQAEEKALTKKPIGRKAGFINASILLYAIMNIAIIIAITIFLL